jgi:hypothetical protein
MLTRFVSAQISAMLAATLCLTAACSQFTMPRLFEAPAPQPTIPASVTLIFDDSVKKATVEDTVCADTLWTGRLGDAIIKAFRQTGETRFAQVTVEGTNQVPTPASAPQTTAITASIILKQASYKTRTRTGSDDTYLSQFDIQLDATFHDATGQPLAQVPLIYSEQVKIWTPQFGGSGSCATGQLDQAVNTAAEQLSYQLASYVGQLMTKPEGQTTAGSQGPGGRPSAGESTALILRATLLDQNNNLVLEGGEKVGIRIDVTNSGTTASDPATVALSGTPALTEAFAEALTTPVKIPALQPGETTSAMVWARLPANLEGPRGELIVTVTPSGTAGTAATQTLVATVASHGGPASSAPSPAVRQAPTATGRGHDPDRYAVIVGLSLYRSPWPGWRDGLSFDAKDTVSLFADSLDVPEGHTLLLQDELAAQTDIEEALAHWLAKRVTKDSIVFFYFAGQTVADARNGEVFLIPYDATPSSSPFRLISLRFLQSRLEKLGARLAIAIIDSPLTKGALSKDGKTKAAAPNWVADLDGSSGTRAGTMVQISRLHGTAGHHNTGLLTGLTGPADLDHDGTVTVGEWLRSLRGTALTAPALPPTLAIQSIPLTQVDRR